MGSNNLAAFFLGPKSLESLASLPRKNNLRYKNALNIPGYQWQVNRYSNPLLKKICLWWPLLLGRGDTPNVYLERSSGFQVGCSVVPPSDEVQLSSWMDSVVSKDLEWLVRHKGLTYLTFNNVFLPIFDHQQHWNSPQLQTKFYAPMTECRF